MTPDPAVDPTAILARAEPLLRALDGGAALCWGDTAQVRTVLRELEACVRALQAQLIEMTRKRDVIDGFRVDAIEYLREAEAKVEALQAELDEANRAVEQLQAIRVAERQMWMDSSGAALARVAALEQVLQLILAEPYGCPMCDSGQKRNPTKEHWDNCGFARAHAALTAPDHQKEL